jgi:hypothetical protein
MVDGGVGMRDGGPPLSGRLAVDEDAIVAVLVAVGIVERGQKTMGFTAVGQGFTWAAFPDLTSCLSIIILHVTRHVGTEFEGLLVGYQPTTSSFG